MTLPINLAELERLAKGAIPGIAGLACEWTDNRAFENDGWHVAGIANVGTRRRAEFIAAANPATMLALISQLRAAMEVVEAARSFVKFYDDPEFVMQSDEESLWYAVSGRLKAYDAIAGETK